MMTHGAGTCNAVYAKAALAGTAAHDSVANHCDSRMNIYQMLCIIYLKKFWKS
jgi:hypothetical protein